MVLPPKILTCVYGGAAAANDGGSTCAAQGYGLVEGDAVGDGELDEEGVSDADADADAAVDADTDARIQKVMRSDFANATCLTVAHRINTIMDSNYILVMSDGQAAEFDTPQRLMDRGGLFRDLVDAAAHEEGE